MLGLGCRVRLTVSGLGQAGRGGDLQLGVGRVDTVEIGTRPLYICSRVGL